MKTKNINNANLKLVILAIAHRYQNIQKTQCDPLINEIEDLLGQLYPLSEQQCSNWAMDIINSSEVYSVTDVLDRMDSYFRGFGKLDTMR
jgi:hypothetical protein|tara:strand:- start:34 stop:303 length:270 start_codon:yes stop_codon:yes gene_type:complete